MPLSVQLFWGERLWFDISVFASIQGLGHYIRRAFLKLLLFVKLVFKKNSVVYGDTCDILNNPKFDISKIFGIFPLSISRSINNF